MPTGSTKEMLVKIDSVLPSIFLDGRRYKKAGIILYGFEGIQAEQLDMFAAEDSNKNDRICLSIDRVFSVLPKIFLITL